MGAQYTPSTRLQSLQVTESLAAYQGAKGQSLTRNSNVTGRIGSYLQYQAIISPTFV